MGGGVPIRTATPEDEPFLTVPIPRVYRREAFEKVGVSGGSWTMVRRLPTG